MNRFFLSLMALYFAATSAAHAQNQCTEIFSKSTAAVIATESAEARENSPLDIFSETLLNDPYSRQQLTYVENQLRTQKLLDSPIDISRANRDFRKQTLPLLAGDPTYREAAIRFMEADLRFKSRLLANKLAGGIEGRYDVVIMGAGVHGVIALNSLLRAKPGLRVLVIEQADTAGSTFRYPNDSFRINSSNRPSGPGNLPLPGQGNINELPQLPIQVSDLSPVKYPTAGDLGSAVVAGLYAVASGNKYKVDVLFSSTLDTIGSRAFDANRKEPFRITGKIDETSAFGINTSAIVLASGLGTPKIPESVRKSLTPEMITSKNPVRNPPQVMTFETVMRILGQSPNPKKLFEGKRIAVAGVGDSANVFIEFLLGYAAEKGYGLSNGQTGGPSKVFWIGQTRKLCEDFIADARSRYAQIGTGFRSSDPNGQPIIEAFEQKLREVVGYGTNVPVTLKLEKSRKTVDADYVILATGFEGELFRLFQNLYRESGNPGAKNDAELIARFFTDISGFTLTTGNKQTVVGREVKVLDDGTLVVAQDSPIVAVGPGAGKLPQEKELFGIIQNTVSIFNNALRTDAAAQYLAEKVKGTKSQILEENMVIPLNRKESALVVKNIQDARPLGAATQVYLESTLVNALNYVTFKGSASLEIVFAKDSRGLVISSNYDITRLVELLASTRDFFATLDGMLSSYEGSRQSWVVNGRALGRGSISFDLTFGFEQVNDGFLRGQTLTPVKNADLPLVDVVN